MGWCDVLLFDVIGCYLLVGVCLVVVCAKYLSKQEAAGTSVFRDCCFWVKGAFSIPACMPLKYCSATCLH